MKELVEECKQFLKKQDINGCLTGSSLLEYFENQDIDVFVYDEPNFNKLLNLLYYHPDFLILDKLEQWKFDNFINKGDSGFKKIGLITIKFSYKTGIDVNIILKKNCNNIFSVLSSFDMNIIAIGYDLKTKQYLDLSGDSHITKIADWNRWNPQFQEINIWSASRILRQFERIIKYHQRGYNTDNVAKKYLEIIDKALEYESIFNSESFNEKIAIFKKDANDLKAIINLWLETHSCTEKQREELVKLYKSFNI